MPDKTADDASADARRADHAATIAALAAAVARKAAAPPENWGRNQFRP